MKKKLTNIKSKTPAFPYKNQQKQNIQNILTGKYKYYKYNNSILMTDFAPLDFFRNPKTARQKQYDALRDYYLNKLAQKEAAEKHGYTIYTFQTIVRDFKNQKIIFFPPIKKGPKKQNRRWGYLLKRGRSTLTVLFGQNRNLSTEKQF